MGTVMDLTHKNLTELPQDIPYLEEFSFYCDRNELTSLVGSPKKVLKTFYCRHNKLLNLSGAPTEVLGSFDCEFNNLTSLYGCPALIGGDFWCQNNLNLLDISDLWMSDISGIIFIDLNENMAALPLAKFNFHVGPVFNFKFDKKYGSSKQNIIDFQYDLCENGFAEHAKWKP